MSRTSQGCCRYTVLRPRKKSPDWRGFYRKLPDSANRKATVAQTGGNSAVKSGCIAAGTRHHGERHLSEKGFPMVPAGQFGEHVCSHQPDEMGARKAASESADRITGVAGAQPGFDVGGNQAAVGGKTFDRGEALGEGGHPFARFERVARRDHEPDLIEVEQMQGAQSNLDMPLMRGIERSTEKTDPQGAAVSPDGDRIVVRSHGRTYGRVWPVPSTS